MGQFPLNTRDSSAGPMLWRVRTQEDSEYRTGAGGAFDIKKATMAIEDVLDDCEPEPGPAHFARTRGVDPVEALGQPRQVFACDTFPAVAHGH